MNLTYYLQLVLCCTFLSLALHRLYTNIILEFVIFFINAKQITLFYKC